MLGMDLIFYVGIAMFTVAVLGAIVALNRNISRRPMTPEEIEADKWESQTFSP
jgi:hypothetical protein